MAIKSSNTTGNPYHDEGNGQFTSANGSGEKKQEEPKKMQNSVPPTMGPGFGLKSGVNLNGLKSSLDANKGVKKDLSGLMEQLRDFNQVSNIPRLNSARDIVAQIPNFFSKTVVSKIDELYGKSSGDSSYIFRPKTNPNARLNIFVCAIGKYRYKDNHAIVMNKQDFDNQIISYQELRAAITKNRNSSARNTYIYKNRWQPVVRGVSNSGGSCGKLKEKIDSYGLYDKDNIAIYGQDCCYGSNIYTSVNNSYSVGYGYDGSRDGAYPRQGHLITGVLDLKDAYYLESNTVRSIKSQLSNPSTLASIESAVLPEIQKYVSDSYRAQRIAHAFTQAISADEGMTGVLLGLDFQISEDHQRNIYNLKRWILRDDWSEKVNRYGY